MKRWAGHVDIWRIRDMHRGKRERNRPLGRPRGRGENNIKMGFKEII
jgi:hypothetical protein